MKEFKTLGYDWECGHEDLIIRVLSYADRKRLYIKVEIAEVAYAFYINNVFS